MPLVAVIYMADCHYEGHRFLIRSLENALLCIVPDISDAEPACPKVGSS